MWEVCNVDQGANEETVTYLTLVNFDEFSFKDLKSSFSFFIMFRIFLLMLLFFYNAYQFRKFAAAFFTYAFCIYIRLLV